MALLAGGMRVRSGYMCSAHGRAPPEQALQPWKSCEKTAREKESAMPVADHALEMLLHPAARPRPDFASIDMQASARATRFRADEAAAAYELCASALRGCFESARVT